MESFFVDGYVHGFVDKSVNLSIFDTFRFPNCNFDTNYEVPTKAQQELDKLHQYFADEWVGKIFTNFEKKDNGMWDGVDSGSTVWHNDFERNGAFNSNILVYLDDGKSWIESSSHASVECYSSINVRHKDREHVTQIFTSRGSVMWLNQQPCFQHQAIKAYGPRRVLSFEFMIPALGQWI